MGGGNYFSPPILLHAERYSICMQEKPIRSACKRSLRRKWSKSGGERRVTWRGGGGALLFWLLHWRCCGGGQRRCRGSRTAAPSSGETRLFTPLVFRFAFSSFVVKRLPFLHSLFIFLCNSLPCFKLLRVLSFLVGVECGIYRAKESGGVPIATLLLRMGSGAFLPYHDAGWGSQWVWIAWRNFTGFSLWGGVCFDRARREGERQAELKKKQKFLSSPAARLGAEGGGTVSLKTTLFCSFFFNMK